MNNVPPCASSSAPTLRLDRAVAAFDAEQFDFHVLRRDRGGIDDHERRRRRAPNGREWCVRQAPCRCRRGRRSGCGCWSAPPSRWSGAADWRRASGRPASRPSGANCLSSRTSRLQSRILQRPFGDQQQPVGLERFLDEVVGATLDRRNRGLDIAVAGNHHDRQFRVFQLEAVEQLQPVEAAALQPDVEENQIGPARDDGGRALRRCRARCGCHDLRLGEYPRPVRGYPLHRRRSGYRMPCSNRRPVAALPIIRSFTLYAQQVTFTRHFVSISLRR